MSDSGSREKVAVDAVQAALTQAGASWQAGINSLTELPSDQRRLYLGFTPPAGVTLQGLEERGTAIAAGHREALGATAFPPAFDWRSQGGQNYITSVKDQGACGSCVAFGTTAAVEGTLRVQSHNPSLAVDLSEASLFYCIGGSQGRNCGTGWWPDGALTGYQNLGVPDESCFPYTPGDQPCNQCADWAKRATKITAFHALNAVADMKTWLSTRGPTSACLTVYDDFFAYTGGIYHHVTGNAAGGHCVCFVGYEDGLNCWICKNSWGAGWGESGYFRIAYGECGIEGTVHAIDSIGQGPPRPGCLPGLFWLRGTERTNLKALGYLGSDPSRRLLTRAAAVRQSMSKSTSRSLFVSKRPRLLDTDGRLTKSIKGSSLLKAPALNSRQMPRSARRVRGHLH